MTSEWSLRTSDRSPAGGCHNRAELLLEGRALLSPLASSLTVHAADGPEWALRSAQGGNVRLSLLRAVRSVVQCAALLFQYQPIGFSSRLMNTCFVSRYSSTPQCPSSRPKPLIL